MRIMYVIDNLQRGGKERRLYELLRYFESYPDIQATLVLLNDRIEYQQVEKFSNTELYILKRRIKKDPLIFFTLWKICRKTNPEIIHTWGSMPSVYMFPLALILKIPLINGMIVNARCTPFSKDWIRSRISFPFSTLIQANSEAGLNAYKVKKSKGVVIYNGYNFDRNENLAAEGELDLNFKFAGKFIVGMIGSFHPRKDYDTFIRAATEVLKINKDILFLCVGDGEKLEETRTLNKELNPLFEQVRFLGKQNNVESIIKILNIGVLLTNTKIHQEGISNVLMEYMAQGLPVIATRGGGTDELVIHNETGILIDAFDIQALVASVDKLYMESELRIRFGKNGKRRIHNVFSIEQMASKTYSWYQELLKG